jgi:nucleoside phosphorylase
LRIKFLSQPNSQPWIFSDTSNHGPPDRQETETESMMPPVADDAGKYTVGWIAPMALELTAAIGMLDDHESLRMPEDDMTYHAGRIGDHHVVMAVCPRIGTQPAAALLANMRRSFRNIRHVLVVGIAGAVPCYGPNLQDQIVLGDVVVGVPQWGHGGVVHYEFGAWESRSTLAVSEHTLHPSSALLSAVNNLQAAHNMERGSQIPQYLSDLRKRLSPRLRRDFDDPSNEHDHLFEEGYLHSDRSRLCDGFCDVSRSKRREDRGEYAMRGTDSPVIHYGTVGSANTVILSSAKRNELYENYGIICVEMESAGVMSDHQALVIRGICDYADSHKNKRWQRYAAATAAAYAKEVLLLVPQAPAAPAAPAARVERTLDDPGIFAVRCVGMEGRDVRQAFNPLEGWFPAS